MHNRYKRLFAAAGVLLAVSLAACSALDVVGTDSVRAFAEVLDALPPEGSPDEGWTLTAPDGGARLELHNDMILMAADIQPFIDAGLDAAKLDNVGDGSLVYMTPGFDMLNQNIKDTPRDQFEADAQALRDQIGYHAAMDHYTLSFGDGNLFEWAKDLSVNGDTGDNQDKDIVFVLNPEPLISAGVDPEKVEGWTYSQVSVEVDGKTSDVWKLLKPFNLK